MPRRKAKGFDPRKLTSLLTKIGEEIHTVEDGGDPVTKDERLIRLVWDKALGYTEKIVSDDGKETEKKHRPERWAMELVYNRREGAVTPAVQSEDSSRMKASDKVRELAKKRLNKIAQTKDKVDGE